MKKFEKYFKKKVAIHCNIKGDFKKLVDYLYDNHNVDNYNSFQRDVKWSDCARDTCLSLWEWPKLMYSSKGYYEKKEYEIIPYYPRSSHATIERKFEFKGETL